MKKTIFKYIFKMQFRTTIFASLFVFALILLFDFAEVMRKYPISNAQETFFAIKLSLLRTPSTFCEVLRYVYFVAAALCLWNLCRSHQMTILKAIGRSPKQILYPFLSFATIIAATWLLALHPAGLWMEKLYEQNASRGASVENNRDIWIDCSQSGRVIFIKNICGDEIEGLNVFNLKDGSRIFARQASIEKNVWNLKNVAVINDDKIKSADTMQIPNAISSNLIELIAKAPKKQDVYGLYKIYKVQKKDRAALKTYELELHKLLSYCFHFLLFALVAAVVCFPINRYKTRTIVAIKVIATATFLKFANSALESLAHCGAIPPELACWAAPAVLTCFSIAALVWREA
ncbi:MAG: LptF/LptG family permease [Holosporaceae bacterium]|jgi:lipopolysaccharide export system permease protein|nr:LptF/LptG family permease [Holosporaceae bacterium]